MYPGGQPVADALAQLLQRPRLIAEASVWPIQSDGRPQRMKAIIREDECIGCTKCISACPVDAIIGSGKLMHSILTDLCTGCELCIAPCPVDCIDLVEDHQAVPDDALRIIEQNDLRQRYYAHIQREEKQRSKRKGPVVRADIDTALFSQFSTSNSSIISPTVVHSTPETLTPVDAKSTIELAKIRTQIKKLEKQLGVREDAQKRMQLAEYHQQLMLFTRSINMAVKNMSKKQIQLFFERLRAQRPSPKTELNYQNHFELLVAVTLSAQATDVSVNKATDILFPIANTQKLFTP